MALSIFSLDTEALLFFLCLVYSTQWSYQTEDVTLKHFLFLLLLSPLTALANEQYSTYHCDELKAEKEYIQKRFTQGYRIKEGKRLNERDTELFILIAKHCRSPVGYPNSDTSPQRVNQKYRPGPSYSYKAINDNWSARNPTYTGEKLLAWDNFYKIPPKCRTIKQNSDDFIFCSEDKLQQREYFEKYWKNRIRIK